MTDPFDLQRFIDAQATPDRSTLDLPVRPSGTANRC
jgi:uncharacterized protein (DUF1810 family)